MQIMRRPVINAMLTFFSFATTTKDTASSSSITTSCNGVQQENNNNEEPSSKGFSCQYHKPPPSSASTSSSINYYDDNTSVFGEILRGEKPAYVYYETADVLSFRDRTPRAPFHALVIPKKYIKSIRDLTVDDIPLLEEMNKIAMKLIRTNFPTEEVYEKKDYILCYHIPPFNSVNHLHLHVLAPASEMKYIYRYGKYYTESPWATNQAFVLKKLITEKMGK